MLRGFGNLNIRGVEVFSPRAIAAVVALLALILVVRHRIYATVAEESATLGKEVLKQNSRNLVETIEAVTKDPETLSAVRALLVQLLAQPQTRDALVDLLLRTFEDEVLCGKTGELLLVKSLETDWAKAALAKQTAWLAETTVLDEDVQRSAAVGLNSVILNATTRALLPNRWQLFQPSTSTNSDSSASSSGSTGTAQTTTPPPQTPTTTTAVGNTQGGDAQSKGGGRKQEGGDPESGQQTNAQSLGVDPIPTKGPSSDSEHSDGAPTSTLGVRVKGGSVGSRGRGEAKQQQQQQPRGEAGAQEKRKAQEKQQPQEQQQQHKLNLKQDQRSLEQHLERRHTTGQPPQRPQQRGNNNEAGSSDRASSSDGGGGPLSK